MSALGRQGQDGQQRSYDGEERERMLRPPLRRHGLAPIIPLESCRGRLERIRLSYEGGDISPAAGCGVDAPSVRARAYRRGDHKAEG